MNTIQTRAPVPSVAVEVVSAVARHEGVDETELPPLTDAVDPDALDRLFAGSRDGEPNRPIEVGFEYCGVDVVVEGDGTVSIRSTQSASEAAVSAP